MSEVSMTHAELEQCLSRLAQQSLWLWGYSSSATSRLLSHSECAIFLVENGTHDRTILRINREGYNSANAIACELAWLRSLREDAGVRTPKVIPGTDGALVQTGSVEGLPRPRNMVLFEFIEGHAPNESENLVGLFGRLGEVSAHIHNHSQNWQRPAGFERLVWSCENILGGSGALWGDWRSAPAMDHEAADILERQSRTICKRLEAFGQEEHRWGLIHGDLRLANLLIQNDDTRVIDFDDCGLGWYMYDFATALSFIEDHPDKTELTAAWLDGYKRHRALPEEDEREIPTFIMLRRMALLAWLGSHSETDLAKEEGPNFTRVSCSLAEEYLTQYG